MNKMREAEKQINELLALEVADSYPESSSRLDPQTQAFQVGYLRRQLAELVAMSSVARTSLQDTLQHVRGREAAKWRTKPSGECVVEVVIAGGEGGAVRS